MFTENGIRSSTVRNDGKSFLRGVALSLILASASLAVTLPPALRAEPPAKKEVESGPSASDTSKILGTWKVKSYLEDGDPTDRKLLYTFTEKSVRIGPESVFFGGPPIPTFEYSFKLDATKKPKTIAQKLSDTEGELTWTGIYRLDGDTLELCYHGDEKRKATPPATFDGKKGTGQLLIKLQRVKADAKK